MPHWGYRDELKKVELNGIGRTFRSVLGQKLGRFLGGATGGKKGRQAKIFGEGFKYFHLMKTN
jgi:hypothetical protein